MVPFCGLAEPITLEHMPGRLHDVASFCKELSPQLLPAPTAADLSWRMRKLLFHGDFPAYNIKA